MRRSLVQDLASLQNALANFKTVDNRLGVQDLHTILDALPTGAYVGQVVRGYSPDLGDGTFILLAGVASNAKGSAVVFNGLTGAVALTLSGTHLNKGCPVAISLTANTSASKYSWYQIAGNAFVVSPATVAANAIVYMTTSAGLLDDASINGCQILGARTATATAATVGNTTLGAAEFIATLNNPTIQSGAV